jgi:hypothetical protein
VRRLSRNEAKLSLEGAEGNREEKKFEAAGSPKLIGEGESVAGCDISVNDLCGRVITLASFKKIETVGGSTLWRWGSGDQTSITFVCRVRSLGVVLRKHQRSVWVLVVQLVVQPQWAGGGSGVVLMFEVREEVEVVRNV